MSKKSTAFAFDFTITADRTEQTATRKIERGRLVALNVFPFGATTRKGNAFAEISIRQGGENEEHTGATLIADYVYSQHHAAWTGSYPILQQSILHARMWSSSATSFRVTGTIEIED